MQHEHEDQKTCPYCHPSAEPRSFGDKGVREKLFSVLGVCGCISCYFAMFPAILLGMVGVFGLSTASTRGALNAYMNSVLFQPILIASILLLVLGLARYGHIPLVLSGLSGLGIFVSMNIYMRSWLFTLSFLILAAAYYLAYRQSKSAQLKTVLVLIGTVVVLGIVDFGRAALSSAPVTMQSVQPANTQDAIMPFHGVSSPQNMMETMR